MKINVFKRYNSILERYLSKKSIEQLEFLWNDKKRFYHNVSHLENMINCIESNIYFNELKLYEKHTLLIGIFMHDAIYDPRKQDNEDRSIDFFKKSYIGKDTLMVQNVIKLIETTKHRKRPVYRLERIFWDADNNKFKKGYAALLTNEKLIRKENSFATNAVYKEKRISFLKTCLGLFNDAVDKDINKLIKFVEENY